MSLSYGKHPEEPVVSKLAASFWLHNTQRWQVHPPVWCSWALSAQKHYLQHAAAALWLGDFSSLPADSLAAAVLSSSSLKPLTCSSLQPAQKPTGGLYRNRKHKRVRHVPCFLLQLPLKPRSSPLKNSGGWLHILNTRKLPRVLPNSVFHPLKSITDLCRGQCFLRSHSYHQERSRAGTLLLCPFLCKKSQHTTRA